MCFSQSQKQNSTAKLDPYSPARSGIDQAIGGITGWMNDPASRATYQGPRTVGMSDLTRQGRDALADTRGLDASSAFFANLMGGKGGSNPAAVGDINPYLQQLVKSAQSAVMPSINSTFSNAGMTGSTLHQGSLMEGLTNATAQPLFNAFENNQNRRFSAYENDMQRRMAAAGQMPALEAERAQRMLGAGQIGEGYQRDKIAADQAAFNEAKTAGVLPYLTGGDALRGFGSTFGTQTQRSKSSTDPGLGNQILGGAMMGLQMMAGLPPMGGLGGGMSGLMGGGQQPFMGGGPIVGNQNAWNGWR